MLINSSKTTHKNATYKWGYYR